VTEFLGRRLRQLANEREKLLRAYYADAIEVATLKREQARINAEVTEAESQLADDGGEAGAGEADHRSRT
jgi:predicted  nucleic acid-binding Zn-ribbon protein